MHVSKCLSKASMSTTTRRCVWKLTSFYILFIAKDKPIRVECVWVLVDIWQAIRKCWWCCYNMSFWNHIVVAFFSCHGEITVTAKKTGSHFAWLVWYPLKDICFPDTTPKIFNSFHGHTTRSIMKTLENPPVPSLYNSKSTNTKFASGVLFTLNPQTTSANLQYRIWSRVQLYMYKFSSHLLLQILETLN